MKNRDTKSLRNKARHSVWSQVSFPRFPKIGTPKGKAELEKGFEWARTYCNPFSPRNEKQNQTTQLSGSLIENDLARRSAITTEKDR
jgi:hypothetical protein